MYYVMEIAKLIDIKTVILYGKGSSTLTNCGDNYGLCDIVYLKIKIKYFKTFTTLKHFAV